MNMIKNLFVTEENNTVIQQFEKEKEEEVKDDLDKKVAAPVVMRGWDSWAGDSVDETRYKDKVMKAE